MTDYGPFTDKAGVQALIDAAIAEIPDGGGGGDGSPGALIAANNLSDLVSASAARTNMGLGSAAVAGTSDFDAAGAASTAQAAAIAAAATDATTKANTAQSAAVAAAATDATTKANNAQAAAIDAAATDATTKAASAQSAAATDATTKANNAQAAAIAAAATDATTKANAAQASALARLVLANGPARYPEDFGAVGDGTTDDTHAIQLAINDAVTYAATGGHGEALVEFQDVNYGLSSAPTKGGSTAGNAIITLPPSLGVNRKVVLRLRGRGSQAPAYWLQTTPQTDGSNLVALNAAPAADGTWHEASILGGPTVWNGGEGGNDLFFNLHVEIEKLNFFQPHNGGWVLVDLAKIASASVVKSKFNAYGSPAGSPSILSPTNTNDLGLRLPGQSNNDVSHIDDASFSGLYYGLSASEHFEAERLGFIYCPYGIYFSASGVPTHGAHIGYMGFEYGKICIQAGLSSSASFPLVVDFLDVEQLSGSPHYDVDDGGNHFYGEIGWAAYDRTDPLMNGGTNLRMKNMRRVIGPMASPPTIPASGSSATLPYSPSGFWIGNVTNLTACTVDGVSVNPAGPIFARSGAVVVPTYSSGGTWNWYSV